MDLLTILKVFLLLGCVSYVINIVSAFKRRIPKVKIQKPDKERKEDGRNEKE